MVGSDNVDELEVFSGYGALPVAADTSKPRCCCCLFEEKSCERLVLALEKEERRPGSVVESASGLEERGEDDVEKGLRDRIDMRSEELSQSASRGGFVDEGWAASRESAV